MTNRALTLLLMLALAVPVAVVPATSFAQSAGDDQYVDPFQDDETGGGNGNQGDNDTPTTPDETVSQAPATTAETGVADETATSGATLPRTGLPTGELVLIGVVLLGGGFALRRAWPLPD